MHLSSASLRGVEDPGLMWGNTGTLWGLCNKFLPLWWGKCGDFASAQLRGDWERLIVHSMGPLHDPVTWYKITHAGEQVAQWDFHNNATHTSPPGSAFVLEVPLCNLLTSICDFVPDRAKGLLMAR